MLRSCAGALSSAYDLAVLDLDGVVYVGAAAVKGAPEALNRAQSDGMHLAFVTNNAARPPRVVGEHLRSLGVEADDSDVVTSAQAAARVLSNQLPGGSTVFALGAAGLFEALSERDLVPVTERSAEVTAVVQGYGPDVTWKQVMQAAVLVGEGLPWVATNTDLTIPTAEGEAPGNGALVALVARFADREPQVAGKPASPLFEETLARVGGSRPLVVGDRLDTDIEGANTMGWDSLLVLTGVTGLAEIVTAQPAHRPTYVGPDLSVLAQEQPVPDVSGGEVVLGGWVGRVIDGALGIEGEGGTGDWWRVAAVTAWRHLDETGSPVATDGVSAPE